MVCLSRPYHFKIFKGCLPQILLGQILNTLKHVRISVSSDPYISISGIWGQRKSVFSHILHHKRWYIIKMSSKWQIIPWTQDVNWTYIRRLMYVQFTSCVQGVCNVNFPVRIFQIFYKTYFLLKDINRK